MSVQAHHGVLRMQIDFSTREGRREQGQLIQQAAEDIGLSLEALAKEISCSRALIYQYVSGATLAQPDRIQQIAQRTGKPLPYFYGGHASKASGAREQLEALQGLLTAQSGPADFPGALVSCEQIITLAQKTGDVPAEANARLRQITTLMHLGEMGRALTAIEQSEPFFRAKQLSAHLRAAEQNRGHALFALGRVEEAERCFRQLTQHGDWEARWQGLVSLASLAEHRGEYRQALNLLEETLTLKDMSPTPRAGEILHLYVRGNIANVYLACGDFHLASAEAQAAQTLALQQSNQDQYLEAMLTHGVCERWEGALPSSRRLLEGAARWARLSGDKEREAIAAAELGRTLVEMGRLEEGRQYGKEALQQAIATGTRRAELCAHLLLAESYLREGKGAEARYHAAQARELSAYLGQDAAQAEALLDIGEAQAMLAQTDEALKSFAEALASAEKIGARLLVLRACLRQAELGVNLAPELLLKQASAVATPLLSWPAWQAVGMSYENIGDLSRAREAYLQAIEVITRLRATLIDESPGDTYLEGVQTWEPYRRLVNLLYRLGATDELTTLVDNVNWPPLCALLKGTTCAI